MKIYLLFSLFAVSTFFTSSAKPKSIIVAKDGSGNFRTVQLAFNSIPVTNKKEIVVFVKAGIYREKVILEPGKNFVKLVGENKFKTIITFNDHAGKVSPSGEVINTRTSASCVIKADDFTAENITFQNDAGFTAGQAVGLEVQGDRAVIKNCRIVGNQDILFTSKDKSRQYYENCYIEGTTDFIFGSSTVWFEKCHINSRKNSHITAAATPKENPFGYVFNECILTGDTSLKNVSLGRPWQPYASVTYIHCFIGPHVIAKGWSPWNTLETYRLSRYAEYENYGPGAGKEGRVEWSKQLSEDDVKNITKEKVLGSWIASRL